MINYTWERKVLISIAVGLVTFLVASCGENAVSRSEEPAISKPTAQEVQVPLRDTLFLTVPDMKRVENLPVYTDDMEESLKQSAYHEVRSDWPWEHPEKDTNTYIAGHRLGYPNTDSWMVFADLNTLEDGDPITVKDSEGQVYQYEVFEKRVVAPDAIEVLEPIKGKDIVTLQTCTLPAYKDRLIVRGELVE